MKNKREMIRILKTESEGIVLDATGRKNGRGAYVCPDGECLKKAIKSRGLDRSFKMPGPRAANETPEKQMQRLVGQEKTASEPDRVGHKGGKNRQRRVLHRESGKEREGMYGDRVRGGFG